LSHDVPAAGEVPAGKPHPPDPEQMAGRRIHVTGVVQDIEAMICWMDSTAALRPRTIYRMKHTTRTVRAMVTDLRYRLDINTMHRDESASELALNEIGRVVLRATEPVFADDYRRNRATGSFILIDESTNQTVAGGMIRMANT